MKVSFLSFKISSGLIFFSPSKCTSSISSSLFTPFESISVPSKSKTTKSKSAKFLKFIFHTSLSFLSYNHFIYNFLFCQYLIFFYTINLCCLYFFMTSIIKIKKFQRPLKQPLEKSKNAFLYFSSFLNNHYNL